MAIGGLANVRQAIVGLDDLSRPAVGEADVGNQFFQPLFECGVALRRVFHLAGLVILAAEDHVVVIVAPIDAQIIVRVARVPEQRLGNGAALHPAADSVRAVERQLRLKEARRHQIRHALQRHVRGDEYVLAVDAMAAFGDCRDARRGFDLIHVRALEHVAAFARN